MSSFHCSASGHSLAHFLVAVSRDAYSEPTSSIFKVNLCVLQNFGDLKISMLYLKMAFRSVVEIAINYKPQRL